MAKVPAKWVRTKSDEAAVDAGCTFDLRAAERVRDFFRKFLRHSKGEWAGQPFELLDWQWKDVVAPLFGWKRTNGTRRFRKAGIWVPKKNGKSSLCSAISLYMLVGDREPGAEVYNAAADRDQAGIVYNEAANMVDASESLSSRLELIRSQKRITYAATNSWLKALSADVPTKEGINWHLLVFDEIHAQKKRDLWDTLAYGGAARRQPLLLSISTAGYDRDGIGYEQYSYAKSILEGRSIDTAFFAYVAEAAQEDDWKSPEVWAKANPSLGVTIKLEDLEEACKEAQNSPAKENSFRRYRLNQWTEQDVRWLSIDKWDLCKDGPQADLKGRECWAGLDLSSTLDTTALVLVVPDGQDYDVLSWFWVPEEACKERERSNRTRFDEWIRRGHLQQTEGNAVDYDVIRAKVNELGTLYQIREIAFDPWNGQQLATQLGGDGFNMVRFGQGYASMAEPTKELEKLVLEKRIRHGGHPVLRWMAGNVAVEMDAAGNLKPSKKKSTEKIDGIVALVMALGRTIVAQRGSVYDTRGILTLDMEPSPAAVVQLDAALVVEATPVMAPAASRPIVWSDMWKDDPDED